MYRYSFLLVVFFSLELCQIIWACSSTGSSVDDGNFLIEDGADLRGGDVSEHLRPDRIINCRIKVTTDSGDQME